VACVDPNPKVAGNGIKRLREEGIEVKVGVLEEKARRLNEKFLLWVTRKRPFISLKYAMTLDGKIATSTGNSYVISGEESHVHAHYLRRTHDAIMVGIGTVRADDPQLTVRLVKGRDPVRIVLDSSLSIDMKAKVLDGSARTIIVAAEGADPAKAEAISKIDGAQVLFMPKIKRSDAAYPEIDLEELMKELGRMDITSLLVEGGSAVLGSFFDARLCDRIWVYVAPKLIGGSMALTPIGGKGVDLLGDCAVLEDAFSEKKGNDILISGRVRFKES